MPDTADLLELLQADVTAVLQNTSALTYANIIPDNEGDIEAKVIKALGTLTAVSGKRGLAIVILRPEVTEAEENLPGPPLTIQLEIQVIEQVLFNRGADGTQLRSSAAALHILAALHLRAIGSRLLYAKKDPIKPLPVKPGHVSEVVTLYSRAHGLSAPKTAAIHPEIAAGLITLTSATPGAAIYFTEDGTHPTPANGTLYATPFTAPATGTLIRAAAFADDFLPSDTLEFTITATPQSPVLTLAGDVLTLAGVTLTFTA